MVSPSTVPAWAESITTQSPTEMVSSIMINSPVITSCTNCCEPKPMARPMTPAPARKGATLTPRLAIVVMVQITTRITFMALRANGRMVLIRVLGSWLPRRLVAGSSACWIAVSSTTQVSHVTSKEIKGLELSAGRFTALSSQTGMARDSINGKGQPGLTAANIAGATYQFTDNFVGGVAASDVEDYFKKQYINLNYTLPIAESQALNFDFNGYKTTSDGKELLGNVDNKIWSLAAAYSLGAHKFTIAHQRSTGDSAYNYGIDGGGSIFLANSVQYSDFNQRDERSWQGRYDLNMTSYGVPGLSFMARYVKGDNISTTDGEGKEHEFDFETKYVLQEGPAKDLSFRLRSAIYRTTSNNGNDVNDFRLIAEYPLNIL